MEITNKMQNLIEQSVSLCLRFGCNPWQALNDLSWDTNGLGLTDNEEFLIREQVGLELRKWRTTWK